MASIKAVLDERRILKDGTYPISIRIYLQKTFLAFPTRIYAAAVDWDKEHGQINHNHPDCKHLNLLIKEQLHELSGKLIKFERLHPRGFTYEELKNYFNHVEAPPTTVKSFWENEIQQLNNTKRYGNSRNHQLSLKAIHKISGLDIPFEKVSFTFLKNIESAMVAKGLKVNSIGVYMRSFRAIYNTAINKDVVEATFYPFKKYKIKSEKVVPHNLGLSDLQTYFNYPLDRDHALFRTWALGKLTFLLCGINFYDMVMLTADNIRHDRIVYKRSKTKKLYSISILEDTRQLLETLRVEGQPTLLGILSQSDLGSGPRLPYIVREKNKQFNMKLARLSQLMKLELDIRSYTFRYSIANLARKLGYDIAMISELLGHSHGSPITVGYLEAYDKDRLDAMLVKIIDAVRVNYDFDDKQHACVRQPFVITRAER
ncbi:MAG: phage integrase SAM-like domain-containing protein [Bacteroidota bacterium]|jgi:integrase/recombinase XerD